MSNLTFATGSSGCGPTPGYLQSLNAYSNVTATKVLAPHQRFFTASQAPSRGAPNTYCPIDGMVDDASSLSHPTLLINSVSQFCQKGQRSSPQLARISGGLPSGSSPAAKSARLVHGTCLVARSVESGWRTRRPYQLKIEII